MLTKIKLNNLWTDNVTNCIGLNKKDLVNHVDRILRSAIKALVDQVDRILS